MGFKDYFKNEQLSLGELFEKLKQANPQVELRRKIIDTLDMPEVTFWYKLREEKFNESEKITIAEIVGRPVNQLFPC